MIVVLFRSRLAEPAEGYAEMAAEMLATAKTMPGFIDFKSFKAEDGERLSIVWWQDDETMQAWREHARHLVAQRLGRERWYECYSIEVAEIIRSRRFNRATDGARAPSATESPSR
jgi:heme-degrading monooxygenase HmoA